MTKTCGRLTGITTEHGYLSQDGEYEGTIRLEWDARQEPSDATYTGGWVVEGPKSAELVRKGDLMRARLALPVSVALDLIAGDQDEAPSVVLEMLQDAAVEAAKDAAEDTAAADAEYDQ